MNCINKFMVIHYSGNETTRALNSTTTSGNRHVNLNFPKESSFFSKIQL